MLLEDLRTFAKARRGFVLSEERHPWVALTHQTVVHCFGLGAGQLFKMFDTAVHKLFRCLAEQQSADAKIHS